MKNSVADIKDIAASISYNDARIQHRWRQGWTKKLGRWPWALPSTVFQVPEES